MDNKSIWTKKVLVPFWVVSYILYLLTLAFNALAVAGLSLFSGSGSRRCVIDNYGYEECTQIDPSLLTPAIASCAVAVTLSVIFIITTSVQIFLYARGRLTPKAYLWFEIPKFVVWTIIWILALVVVGRGTTGALVAVWPSLLEASALGSLIYGIVIARRNRHGSGYGPSTQPVAMEGYSQNQGYEPSSQQTQHQGMVQPYQQPYMDNNYKAGAV